MKKFLAAALLALGLCAASEQQADAWINCKFGIGLNWEFSSGNNSWLCGLFHNGPGGPECGYGMPNCGYGYGGFAAPYAYGAPVMGGYNYAGTVQQPGYNYAGTPAPSPYQLMSYPGAGSYYPNYYATGYYGY